MQATFTVAELQPDLGVSIMVDSQLRIFREVGIAHFLQTFLLIPSLTTRVGDCPLEIL